MLQTEFAFVLPRGLVDGEGVVHRDGLMRLAKASDEIALAASAGANDAEVSLALLSRVVMRIGDISPVATDDLRGLFASDFAYLQQMYVQLNDAGSRSAQTRCPGCGRRFELDLLAAIEDYG